jgi:hypothetical protein
VTGRDRRALPGWAVDLARDGVPPRDLCRDTIYRAVCRVALSAVNAGWTFPDFDGLLAAHGSQLGNQLRSGGRGRPDRPRREVERALRSAWHSAERKAVATPAQRPIEQVKAQVAAVRVLLAHDGYQPGRPTDPTLLAFWADSAERYTNTQPVLPARDVAAALDLSLGGASNALRAARADRLLTRVERGDRKRASRYALGPAVNTLLSRVNTTLPGGSVFIEASEIEVGSHTEPPDDEWDCAAGDCPPPEEVS